MSKYIDAEVLKDRIRCHDYVTGGDRKPTNYEMEIAATVTIKTLMEFIDRCPQADVAPVIHAKWVRGKIGYSCSNCLSGDDFVDPSTCYCPSCGAKMDLDAIGTVEYEKGDNE